MKKIITAVVLLIILGAAIVGWLVIGPATGFEEKSKYLYVATGKAYERALTDSLKAKKIVTNTSIFRLVANQLNLYQRLKPGRYEIKKGESVLTIVRRLRNNQQSPVKLVINKIRTQEDLAKLIGKNFETDSTDVMEFLSMPDSIAKLGVNDQTFMTIIIPNTYTLFWTTSPGKIFTRLKGETAEFWDKNNRKQKAEALGFTRQQIYTIASIVEEETNKQDEKGNIASVYINRYHKGMPLGADPTIKFALKDFSLKRILYGHLQVASPYNTYKNQGLPPGPICTPSSKTIDAVLDAPRTDYLFFVAKSDFSGYHTFATNFADHIKYAKEYQRALDEYLIKKQRNSK
jgi:UPF0755 protein